MKTTIATALASGEATDAAAELTKQVRAKLGNSEVRLLVAFASTMQPLGQLVERLASSFPGTTLIASSTAGEFTERGDAKGSVSLFALAGDYRVYAGMGVGLKKDSEQALTRAIEGLPRELNGYPHRTGLLLLDPRLR